MALARRRLDRGQAERGGKVSEDIVVPLDRLAEAIEETVAIGARHGLEACSWGHAGDGNLHSTFLVDPGDEASWSARERAPPTSCSSSRSGSAASISGEHGLGWSSAASSRASGRPARSRSTPR